MHIYVKLEYYHNILTDYRYSIIAVDYRNHTYYFHSYYHLHNQLLKFTFYFGYLDDCKDYNSFPCLYIVKK